MNEEALQYSYDLFKKDGYNGSFDDYKKLVKEDTEALDYSYKLFNSDGYDGTIEDFTKLITTEPAKEEAVATDPAPVTAVKEAGTDSKSEDGSLDSQEAQPLNSKFEAYFNKQQKDLGIEIPKVKELPVQEQEDFLNATEQLFPGSKQDFKTAAYKLEIKEEAENIFKNRFKDLETTDLGTVNFDDKKSIANFRKKSLIDFTSSNPVIQNEIIPKVKKEVEPQINEYVEKSMIKYKLNDPKTITQENVSAFNKDVGNFYNLTINTKIASNQEFKAITNAFDESMNDMSSGYLRDFTKSKDMPLLFSLAEDVKDTWYLNEAIFGTLVKGLTSAVTGYRSMKSSFNETGTNLLIKNTTDKIVDFEKNKALASKFGWDDNTEGYFTDDPTSSRPMQFNPKYAKDSRSLDSQGLPVDPTKTNYKSPRYKTITWGDFQNKIKNYTKEKDDLARKNLVEIQNENEVLQNYNDNELDEIFKGNDIFSNLISLTGEQLPQMALSLLTLGATGAVQMGGDIYTQGIDNEARKRFNIPEDEKVSIEQKREVFLDKDFMDALEVKSVAGGFVTGQLERFGAGKALKPFVTKGTQSVLRTGYKNFLKNSANNLVSNTQNSAVEAITEVAQEIIVAGASGGELSTGQIFDSGATGFLVSMTTGLGGNIKNQSLAEAKASSKIIAGKLNPESAEAIFNFKIKEIEDLAKKEIDSNVKKDLIEKRDILIETRNASSSIPKDFSVDSRSKAIDLLVKKKQLEKQIEGVDPEFAVAQKEQINNINKELQQVAIDNRLEKNISSISKIVEDIESVDLRVMEPNELKSFLEKQTKLFNGKTKDSKIAEAMASQGFIFQDPNTGKQSIIINKDVARKTKAVNVAAHEFLHALLFETLKNNPEAQKNLGNSLKEYINKIDIDQVKNSEFKRRLQEYNDKPENVQAEEVLTLFSDAIATGDMKFNESIATKIGDIVRRLMQSLGVKIKFNEGKDVYKFIKDYNKSAFKGKLTKSQKEAFKGVKGSLVPIKAIEGDVEVKQSKPSKVADIESQIETLEDKYDDGLLDYDDYEQQLDNLESKLNKAKSAPVEEKVVSKPKTKEVKENTEEVIKKASDKVFKDTEVSDKNKGISKINEDIADEMLELGANSVSDIKDPAKRKAIIDKLGKNNLGAVTNLTKKAAAVGKDLAIDSNLKIGYDEFFSGFSEELSALIQTYKVKVDGKKVPFGAYMNKNLSLRYGQILDKALKGRVQNAQSLDVESGSVGSVKEIAAEGSRDFDAYTSADKGLPAGELIDVTNFRNVKDRVEAVKNVINLEGVDVADLTYKKVVDDYAGVAGAEVIGLHDKNAEPEKGQDKNDFQKLAERIDGTRTLNYGKGANGEAEVRAMQKLFIDYNDMVKFIKTIPEFNVAPFETTIDKQGRSIDLTADAKGYSVGTSNVLLKELYDIYIDPKSKSTDKATKSRSITSPSGRGKGKTSQVAKVYRLKDKFRGRVDRKTVKELQKTIGITEAGEAFIPMKGVNRTKFGTALQGLTKIYAANVANTVIRKDIVDKGITSKKKSTEKVLADIGGGKSSVMFSKAVENFDPTFNVNFSKSFNKMINDEFGFKTKYYSLDLDSKDWPKQRKRFLNDYEKFVKSTAIGAFKPRFFISSKNTVNANAKKTDPLYEPFYKERRDVRNEIRNINQKYKLSNIGFVTPPSANGKDVKSIEKNIKNGNILKNNQKYSSLFDKTWISISELIRNDRSMIPFIGHFLETSGETDHWTRLGAEFVAYDTKPRSVDFTYVDKNGKKATVKVNYEYEHAVPVNIAVKELFRAAADKNVDFLQELKRVKENYKLIALSAQDNKKLIKAGYASKMPENWNVFWDRYFNSKVAKIDGGINIENIMLIETINGEQLTTPLNEVIGVDNAGSNISFSKGLSKTFNEIIENKTGIKADDTISEVKAKMLANSKRRFNIFIPPSAEDFVGLLYATLGKGKIGDRQMKFYDRTLLKPYARAMQAVTRDRLDLGRSFKRIKKEFNTTPKDLKKKVPGSLFDKEQAVRIYIWDSIGKEVPGLSTEEVNELANYVADNENLKQFAEQVMRLNPGSKYLSPKEGWETGTITTDLLETLNESRRAKHLERWQQNVDDIFSKENLNKLEAAYGTSYRKAVENILTRMKTGRNRTYGTDSQTSKWLDWLNGSVGTIMFFNTRSAILQTLSATNFINFGDNNVFAAGKAFANQKQYWSDFAKLMNSEYLLERRDSLKINVNEADIADAARQKGARGAINYLLKLGFTPTKFADSFAIASGGATFYRNRLNALIKKGMDPVAAEKAAMRDFIETAEESQQSSRPDKISQEQAGPLGRLVLAFANTPAQYARIIKKAALDLKNGRGDAKTNISKIMYYGVLQNVIFNALQQALFAVAFGDEEDEEMLDDKKLNIANGMLDSFIRGTGILGAVFTVVKNTGIKLYKESEKRNPKYGETVVFEALKISPPISSKASKIRAAGRTLSWEMDEIKEKGFDITNPAVGASASVISAFTNIPLDRVVRKVENLSAASDSELETYKRLALTLGWGKWELGIKEPKKKKKKKTGKSRSTSRSTSRSINR